MSLVTVSSLHVLLFSKGFTNAYARGGKREDWWVGGLQEVLDNEAVNLQRERSQANAVRNSLEEIRRQLAQAQQAALVRSADYDDLKEKHAKAKRARDQLDARNEDLKRRISAVSAQLAEAQEALRLEQDLRVAAQAQLGLALEGVKVPEADETSHLKALEGARSTTLNIVYNNTVGMTGEMIYNVQTWFYALQHVSGTKTDGTKFERYNVRSVTTGGHAGEVNVPIPAPDISGSIAKVEACEAKIAELEREIADLKAVCETQKEWLDGWVKKGDDLEREIVRLEAALEDEKAGRANELNLRREAVKTLEEKAAEITKLEADLKGFVGDGSNLGGLYIDGGTLWLRRAIWDAIRKGPKEQIAALKREVAMLQNRIRALEAPVPQNVKSVGDVEGSMWVTILREDYHDLKARAERTDKDEITGEGQDRVPGGSGLMPWREDDTLEAPKMYAKIPHGYTIGATFDIAFQGWDPARGGDATAIADISNGVISGITIIRSVETSEASEERAGPGPERASSYEAGAQQLYGDKIGSEPIVEDGKVIGVKVVSGGLAYSDRKDFGISFSSVPGISVNNARLGAGEHGAEDFSSQIPHVQV